MSQLPDHAQPWQSQYLLYMQGKIMAALASTRAAAAYSHHPVAAAAAAIFAAGLAAHTATSATVADEEAIVLGAEGVQATPLHNYIMYMQRDAAASDSTSS
jgi:hypothetical protein